ncbi:DUF2235 domain-containing protein [Bordetella sp. LUAb4]|uniref:T6SS phospholipase effector Tle1-like catalytic domain-containing protein n=1 Tax=Bordetella sp. LUAb4 TaxID=2843195 RepID=UPI001E3117BB|nr:DUF2235 domain-containing protein [Bordetella sp. LUAb4]
MLDEKPGCPQILHVNLFFDGTNNNLHWDIKSADKPTHTNVARLYLACPRDASKGVFSDYIPGVGTPFPEIGEDEFTSQGKAFAKGFGMRVAWGYTRVLNALYTAITERKLLEDKDARELCSLMDSNASASNHALGILDEVKTARNYYGYQLDATLARLHAELSVNQKRNSGPGGELYRSIQKVWINVIGFSRGAASARVFVNRLINRWAPGGLIAGAIRYEVNFLGLMDTVASVGFPDSTTAASNLDVFDGHWVWTANGALDVPPSVRKCVHFFSIHEQRMSFPLDSIRDGNSYPGKEQIRKEVAYPGVHSDVGGGYPIGGQGKSREGEGSKLSQIPLHNMYVEALKAGVPLSVRTQRTPLSKIVEQDFRISPSVVQAFNDWLSTVNQTPLDSVETALQIGMSQSLAWRTLRADIGSTHNYITAQEFFRCAPEDPLTPYAMEVVLSSDSPEASKLEELKHEKDVLLMQLMEEIATGKGHDAQQSTADAIKKIDTEILEAAAGRGSRPGEGPDDITINDKTDLLEAAEEFRLLLAYLRPQQRSNLQVYWATVPAVADELGLDALKRYIQNEPTRRFLTVARADVGTHPRHGSKTAWMIDSDVAMQLSGLMAPYMPIWDFLLTPREGMLPFLLRNTSDQAVRALSLAVVRLMDDYVHDSRAWFRVPYFHEYAPGGFGWPRTFFVGKDNRVRNLGLDENANAVADKREGEEYLDLRRFLDASKAPHINVDLTGLQAMRF